MRVPPANIDESNPIFVAHQSTHALGFEFKSLRVDGIAIGGTHLFGHLRRHFVTQFQAIAHRRLEVVAGIHVAQDAGLPFVEGRLAHVLQRQVGYRRGAFEGQRQGIGEGNRRIGVGGADQRFRETP